MNDADDMFDEEAIRRRKLQRRPDVAADLLETIEEAPKMPEKMPKGGQVREG